MKTRNQMTKPEFIVKEKDGIVVCKIETNATFKDIVPMLSIYKMDMFKQFGLTFIDNSLLFTAVTRLHKGDTWDEIKGKRIAESKCKRKIFDFYRRVYTHFIYLCERDLDIFKMIRCNTTNAMHVEDKHLKELMK